MQGTSNGKSRLTVEKVPDLLEYLGFVFMGGSLLAGPYYEYADYMDFVHSRGVGRRRGVSMDLTTDKHTSWALVPLENSCGDVRLVLYGVLSSQNFRTGVHLACIIVPRYRNVGFCSAYTCCM